MLSVFRKLKTARKALLYYANRDTYRRKGTHPQGSPVRYKAAPIVDDHGSRARVALREIEATSAAAILFRKLLGRQPSKKKYGPPQVPAPLASRTHEDTH